MDQGFGRHFWFLLGSTSVGGGLQTCCTETGKKKPNSGPNLPRSIHGTRPGKNTNPADDTAVKSLERHLRVEFWRTFSNFPGQQYTHALAETRETKSSNNIAFFFHLLKRQYEGHGIQNKKSLSFTSISFYAVLPCFLLRFTTTDRR